jgi:Domain of unknown function (DUF4326)
MPANTVKVDRTTRWGNHPAAKAGATGDQAVHAFKSWLETEATDEWKKAAVATLGQKNLACWCRIGTPCHGDLLIAWVSSRLPHLLPADH